MMGHCHAEETHSAQLRCTWALFARGGTPSGSRSLAACCRRLVDSQVDCRIEAWVLVLFLHTALAVKASSNAPTPAMPTLIPPCVGVSFVAVMKRRNCEGG